MFWKKERSFKFITTFELGRLCKWLRILGYDVVYFDKGKKKDLVLMSLREDRVILTREKGMSKYTGTRMIHIENDFVEDQIRQVLKKMRLSVEKDKIFSRCVLCNSSLHSVKKDDVKAQIPPYVYKTQNAFLKCDKCDKVYWKGTHWNLANKFLREKAKT